jgi:hypothetical protein
MRKRINVALSGLLFVASCQKELKKSNESEFPTGGGGGGGSTLIDKLKSLAQAFLYDARISSTFKKAIYNECLKEKYDDYYITVKDLIAMNDTLHLYQKEKLVEK